MVQLGLFSLSDWLILSLWSESPGGVTAATAHTSVPPEVSRDRAVTC